MIDGGSGRDTAVFTGLTTDYDFVANVDGSIDVIDKRNGGPDGRDTLRNVEALQFSNGTISLKGTAGADLARKRHSDRRERAG